MSNIDKDKMVGDCTECGKSVPIVYLGTSYRCKFGRMSHAHKKQRPFNKALLHKGVLSCWRCGKENDDARFFDVHHKDSNHKNNDMSNLEFLCPNCHRIETIELWKSWEK